MIHHQQRILQLRENNLIRRIAGVKRAERRRMKDLGEEIGTEACIVDKIGRPPKSCMKTGCMVNPG